MFAALPASLKKARANLISAVGNKIFILTLLLVLFNFNLTCENIALFFNPFRMTIESHNFLLTTVDQQSFVIYYLLD